MAVDKGYIVLMAMIYDNSNNNNEILLKLLTIRKWLQKIMKKNKYFYELITIIKISSNNNGYDYRYIKLVILILLYWFLKYSL